MSGVIILRKERSRYRFTIENAKGDVFFTSSFAARKERALDNIEMMRTIGAKDLDEHMQEVKGPDGKFMFRGLLRTEREGERGITDDALPLGYSAKYDSEKEMKAARKAAVEAAHGAELKDETGE